MKNMPKMDFSTSSNWLIIFSCPLKWVRWCPDSRQKCRLCLSGGYPIPKRSPRPTTKQFLIMNITSRVVMGVMRMPIIVDSKYNIVGGLRKQEKVWGVHGDFQGED